MRPIEVEAIRQIVGARIPTSQRRQSVELFDEFQNAAEVMVNLRNITAFCILTDDDQGNTKTIRIRIVD